MNIALDVGFSAVKQIAGDSRVIFPSVVGTPMPQASFSIKHNMRALAVSGNGHYTPVGDTALLQSQYVSGRRDPEWVLSQDWMTLFQTAISEVITTPLARVKLVTGLPVGDWNRFQEQLRKRLTEQTFQFKRIGRDVQRVDVTGVIIMTQPYGSLLDKALDNAGRIVSNPWSEGRVGIVDIGGNTMNLLTVNSLEEVTQLTTSDEFGLLRALDDVRTLLHNSFTRFSPDVHEVSEWLAKGTFRYQGAEYRTWDYAEAFLTPLIDLVITKVAEVWPESGRFDAVLLAGGGAAVLGRYIKAKMAGQFANVEITSDPRWSNVRGYWKLAVREFGD